MESVSEKTERNTSEDKFNSKILTEKPTGDEPEKVVVGPDEHVNDTHLEAMAELHNKAGVIEENGREEKRPKLENLPDTEDHEAVDINSVSEGKENNIMITSETNTEQNLKPEEETDQEKQQIFENKFIKSEEIEDTTVQAMDLVSEETGEKEADIQAIENEVEFTKEDTQEKLGKEDKTEKDTISDTSKVIGTNEAEDVAQRATENSAADAQRSDGKEVGDVGQTLAIKSTEGPEAGGTEKVSVEEKVETNETDKKSIDGKGEEQLISSSENTLEASEEVRTNEVEITESSGTEGTEVRSVVTDTDQKALERETPDVHKATTQMDTEQKEIPCDVPAKAEPQVTAASQPTEPQPVPIPSININPEYAENKGEICALSKTETMLPESENQKENDTDSGTGSTADNSSIDLNLSISSFLSKTKDSGSISLQVSVYGPLFGFFFVILAVESLYKTDDFQTNQH